MYGAPVSWCWDRNVHVHNYVSTTAYVLAPCDDARTCAAGVFINYIKRVN